MKAFTLRHFSPEDLPALAALFYDTVHQVNRRDYTPAQLDAWAPKDMDMQRWLPSLIEHETILAQTVDGTIVGFGDMSQEGHFDRLYVHKDFQHQGIATAIADHLEAYAVALGCIKIETHASITALPFFEARGYTVLKAQQVERFGQLLTNYVMCKLL